MKKPLNTYVLSMGNCSSNRAIFRATSGRAVAKWLNKHGATKLPGINRVNTRTGSDYDIRLTRHEAPTASAIVIH